MAETDLDRDERIAHLLDEMSRPGSTMRDADTLWHTHPDVAQELIRLARTEVALQEANSDWQQPSMDETVSHAVVGAGHDTHGDANGPSIGTSPEYVGRYRIKQRLGEGGMGAVYAADDPQLQRIVAIKVPHFAGSAERQEQARRRFLREARAAAAVEHTNVCSVHDVGECAGRPFVVMALIDGETLADWLHKHPRMEQRAAVHLAIKIGHGLAAVHAHGIVHRDLKPGNVLLRSKDGEPILTDFGLAQTGADEDKLTADGIILGTPAYMAPEQADPKLGPITVRSDVYSFGVILFKMLTGRCPFEGAMMQILGQLGSSEVPSVSQFRADIDPSLVAIVSRALARRPADRYAGAADFAEALQSWLDNQSATTATVTRPRTKGAVEASVPKHRHLWLGVGAVVIVLFGSLAAYLLLNQNDLSELPRQPVTHINDKGGAVDTSLTPIRGAIDLRVWHKARLGGVGMRLSDPAALPLTPGDLVRIEIELNRPAYCYVLWIDTEGNVSPFYPWLDQDWMRRPTSEAPTKSLAFPDQAHAGSPLGPGPAGIETLVLFTRDEPLAAEIDLPKLIGPLPIQKAHDLRSAAWFENGTIVRNEVNRGPLRLDQVKAIDNPILQTQTILRKKLDGLFRYSRGVSFSNRGDR